MKNQIDIFLFCLAAILALCLLFGGQAGAGAKLAETVTVGMLAYMRGASANG